MFSSLKQLTKYLMIAALLTPALLPLSANAQIYEGVREMDWDSSKKRCVGGGYNEASKKHTANDLNFNPFGSNADINWELTNGVCAAYIASIGTAMLAIQGTSYAMCTATNPIGAGLMSSEFAQERAANSNFPYVNPSILVTLGLRGKQCGSRSSEYATLASAGGPGSPAAVAAAADVARCCPAFTSYGVVVASAVTALAIIYGVSNGAYRKARICGHDWRVWAQVNDRGETDPNGSWRRGAYDGSYKKVVQDYALSGTTPNLSNQKYREYIFGGKEFEDSGDGACEMPKWSNDLKDKTLGYHDKKNIPYYMTGPNDTPVFACYRFLMLRGSTEEIKAGQDAYNCCVKRSQNTVCIENAPNIAGPEGNNYEHVFCEIGGRCNVKGVWFDAYTAQSKSNYACARTYSGCPYNHPLGGGTEKADYSDENDPSQMQNYCQYMNHCSILPIPPYVARSSLSGAFFDSSCRDMKGDSQNVYGYSSNLLPVDVRGFSSPMAQCFKETIQNIFFNRAGSTICLDASEFPDINGKCGSGYKYKKGEDLSNYQRSMGQSGESFFVRIQKLLQNTIRMALSVAIMFFGVSVLIAGSALTKKQMIPLMVKIAFVMYFATGNEWQNWVVNGIIDSSAQLSDMMFRTDAMTGTTVTSSTTNADGQLVNTYATDAQIDQNKLDGCQFPRYNYADTNDDTKYDIKAYPPGKDYIRVWDTLDCKISRALGYGIEVSVPNLVMMIVGGFFTGGAGVVFLIATFAFAFFLIAITIRALHIFIMSIVSIIILLYVSPIMVTMVMFSKTKGMFESWWKNILGFALQPMILFMYMGILLTFFDTVLMGDVTFIGDGKNVPKQVVCSGAAVNTSIYCIFNPPISGSDGAVKTYDKLKMLGIGLPILTSINQAKIGSLMKASILFFVLMSLLDKISGLASTLVGGATLSSNTMKASELMQQSYDMASGVQKRGIGALRKNGWAAAKKAGSTTRKGFEAMGDRGKKAADAPGPGIGAPGNDVGASGGQGQGDNDATTSPLHNGSSGGGSGGKGNGDSGTS